MLLGSLIALAAPLAGPAASGGGAVPVLRIGLIDADPARTLHDFDPLVKYFRTGRTPSQVRRVTVFVAKDLEQLRGRLEEGELDLILTSAFPLVELEDLELVPSVIALRGAAREHPAVFFAPKQSPLKDLADLRGRTVALATSFSTAGYALPKAELQKNQLSVHRSTDWFILADSVRYTFAGEPINQAYWVLEGRADAGAVGSSDWEAFPRKVRSRLRIFHRTEPVVGLLGSFPRAFPPALREAVENDLVDMRGNEKGRTALAAALHITAFERFSEADRESLLRFETLVSAGTPT